ncbi:MAG: hypothetical protein HGA26_00270, partial [Chlorobiaceae bacterium]|nr:hypothetical protein [Chlorobiaceae bacterium]
MKKRNIALIALFVALGAGKANAASVNVTDYSDGAGAGTLRYALNNIPDP